MVIKFRSCTRDDYENREVGVRNCQAWNRDEIASIGTIGKSDLGGMGKNWYGGFSRGSWIDSRNDSQSPLPSLTDEFPSCIDHVFLGVVFLGVVSLSPLRPCLA